MSFKLVFIIEIKLIYLLITKMLNEIIVVYQLIILRKTLGNFDTVFLNS